METIDLFSFNYDFPPKRIRPTSRGIVTENGKILLTYERNNDVYMTPGGGKEADESFEECCKREFSEESGYIINPLKPYVIVNEYCFDTLYEAHYFICEITGKGERQLTETEIEHGVEALWLPIEEAIEIFSHYDEKSEDIRSLYRREYTVLTGYFT